MRNSMADIFSKIREKFSGTGAATDEFSDDYVEIDTKSAIGPKTKVIVRPFVVNDFADIKPALDSLREGYTIALINIKPLRDKDLVELKRAINKIKKTCEAIEGDIAGFGEDWIVVTPSFASVYRNTQISMVEE